VVLIDQQTLNAPADLATSLLEKYSQLTSAVQTEVAWLMTVAEAELSMASAAIRTINAVGSVPENPAVYDDSNFSFLFLFPPPFLPPPFPPPPPPPPTTTTTTTTTTTHTHTQLLPATVPHLVVLDCVARDCALIGALRAGM